MSLTLNMVGGGKGIKNTDAILAVTVESGSTVTATKSGITLTPTMWTQSSDSSLDCAIFSIPSSTFDSTAWTVTGTKGTFTVSKTITINTAKQYDLRIWYRLYLRKGSDACTSATGGWTNTGRPYSSSYTSQGNLTVTTLTNPDGVRLSQGSSAKGGTYVTANAIYMTPYSSLKFTGKINSASNDSATQIQIGDGTGYFSNYTARFVQGANQTKTYTDSTIINVSSLDGNYKVNFSIYSTDGKYFEIYELYLDP